MTPKIDYQLYPGESKIFRTRLTVEIPEGFFGWITNKSKNDFLVVGGIIDQYQGELLVKLINPTDNIIEIRSGQGIAQLIILPCVTPEVVMVDPWEIHQKKTDRGTSGCILSQLSVVLSMRS